MAFVPDALFSSAILSRNRARRDCDGRLVFQASFETDEGLPEAVAPSSLGRPRLRFSLAGRKVEAPPSFKIGSPGARPKVGAGAFLVCEIAFFTRLLTFINCPSPVCFASEDRFAA